MTSTPANISPQLSGSGTGVVVNLQFKMSCLPKARAAPAEDHGHAGAQAGVAQAVARVAQRVHASAVVLQQKGEAVRHPEAA